ncbi:MAG: retron system putative HNH endonuclease, partial [Hyphomonadaceae bacterium]|nr:retron system putative HNH endonuclease [Hyphomonadaceae bacterium]
MRKLTKGGAPQVLIDNAAAWAADWVAANADDKKKLIQRYRHPQVRAAVRQETNKKCAYCEIKMEAGSFAHIEHIMPKSHFPERAFDWQNLTNGCPACNGNKGDTIPTPNNFVSPYSNPEARLSV